MGMQAESISDTAMNALIVVDVQHDFLPAGAVPTWDKGIVAVVRKLMDCKHFSLIVASQDWHPKVCKCRGTLSHLQRTCGQLHLETRLL